MKRNVVFVSLLLATGVVLADDAPAPEHATGAAEAQEQKRELSGMSILGNQEAPKSLVIVPWKSSVLGDTLGIAPLLDDSRQPVDRDVFMRALSYYEIRSESGQAAPAENSAAQSANASHRRKS